MKKLLILMLVLGLASVSQATWSGFTVGGASEYAGTAGETITVNLIADLDCSGASLDSVAEGDSAITANQIDMGGAIVPQAGNAIVGGAGFTVSAGGFVDNYQGSLFGIAAGTAVPAIAPGSVILSFNYTIDAMWDGSEYWVSPMAVGATYTYPGGSLTVENTSYASLEVAGTPTDVLIEGLKIVPEPMTIALLGLGGLVLLRRRK